MTEIYFKASKLFGGNLTYVHKWLQNYNIHFKTSPIELINTGQLDKVLNYLDTLK